MDTGTTTMKSVGHGHEAALDSAPMAAMLEAEGELSAPLTVQAIASASRLIADRDGSVRRALDLGCGPGVATTALAAAFPGAAVVAVDGSTTMLASVDERAGRAGLGSRVETRLVDLNGDLGLARPLRPRLGSHVAAPRGRRGGDAPTGPGSSPATRCAVRPRAGGADVGAVGQQPPAPRPRRSPRRGVARAVRHQPSPPAGSAERRDLPGDARRRRIPGGEPTHDGPVVRPPDDESVGRVVTNLVERTVTELEGHADEADLTALRTFLDRCRACSPSVPAGTGVRMSRKLFLAVR